MKNDSVLQNKRAIFSTMNWIFPITMIEANCRRPLDIKMFRWCLSLRQISIAVMLHCSISFCAVEALAQSATGEGANPFTNSGEVANPRAPRKSTGFTIQLTKRQCRQVIVSHKASNDVAYEPGVDVRGNPVAPADLAGGFEWITPDTIEFDLAFNPLGNTGLDPDDFANTSAKVGHIKYDILSGNLTLNGRPIADPLLAILEAQCRAAGLLD